MSVKIFLSTVSDEFLAYRDQLRGDLTRHNVEVKIQEDFKDYGGSTLDMLDTYIGSCDAVIHLVGDMTGAEPAPTSSLALLAKYPDMLTNLPPLREALGQDNSISYTQWEAWLALYHHKVLVIAEADKAAPRGPNYVPTDNSRAAQAEHLKRLRGFERYSSTFTSPDNLAKLILSSAILDLLTKAQRGEAVGALRSFPYAAVTAGLFLLFTIPLAAEQLTKKLDSSLAAPIVFAGAFAGLALTLIYWRYISVLGGGAEPRGSLERQAYDALRESLARGGASVHLYSRWLTAFLDAVDRFFGDAGMADRTLFPRAFGLRTPAPLWTAPAFDRCLLLALLYPIVTIFIMWAASGHAGSAERALGLSAVLLPWQRGLVTAAVGLGAFVTWRYACAKGRKSLIWIAALVLAGCAAAAIGFAEYGWAFASLLVFALTILSPLVVAGVAALIVSIGGAGFDTREAAFNVTYAVATAVIVISAITGVIVTKYQGALSVALAISGAITGSGAVAIVVAIGLAIFPPIVTSGFVIDVPLSTTALPIIFACVMNPLNTLLIRRRLQGIFLSVLLFTLTLVCLVSAYLLSSYENFGFSGPPLFFIGLLTLLNAPFDWASLGLTRALLRRGLELKGWWPYLFALADALSAAVLISLLALAMVIGAQAFEDFANLPMSPIQAFLLVRANPTPPFEVSSLLKDMSVHPGSPEFWWVYVLLLSTMIPSLVNLMIGGTALLRAVPGFGSLLLRYMPFDRAVPFYDRAWVALVLTLQAAGGIILGVAAQALLAVGLIFYAMPPIGLKLLNLAGDVAAFDLPMKILTAF